MGRIRTADPLGWRARSNVLTYAKGRVREIEGNHVEDVLRAYAGVRSEARLLRTVTPGCRGSFYVTLFLEAVAQRSS